MTDERSGRERIAGRKGDENTVRRRERVSELAAAGYKREHIAKTLVSEGLAPSLGTARTHVKRDLVVIGRLTIRDKDAVERAAGDYVSKLELLYLESMRLIAQRENRYDEDGNLLSKATSPMVRMLAIGRAADIAKMMASVAGVQVNPPRQIEVGPQGAFDPAREAAEEAIRAAEDRALRDRKYRTIDVRPIEAPALPASAVLERDPGE